MKHKTILPEILLMFSAAAALLLALILPFAALAQPLSDDEIQLTEAFRRGEIVRLHILAGSDSPEDQRIKLLVRDAVIAHFGGMMKESGADSAEAVCAFLHAHLEDIRLCAENAARKAGYLGPVKAEFGLLHLPEKTYGRVTLPEGEYRGLRITLGNGGGQNWWCVLYPELCLTLITGREEANPPLIFDSLRIVKNWLMFSPLYQTAPR